MRNLLPLLLIIPSLSLACAAGVPSADDSESAEALTASPSTRAIAAAAEADVKRHAHDHVVTTIEASLGALTHDAAQQKAVKKAIDAALPDGSSSPFYGTVTVAGTTYLWVDAETDEGEGPTPMGTTFVFNATGHKVLSRGWFSSHDYN